MESVTLAHQSCFFFFFSVCLLLATAALHEGMRVMYELFLDSFVICVMQMPVVTSMLKQRP